MSFWIIPIVLAGIAVLILIGALICFFMAFYSPKRKPLEKDEYAIPNGSIYEPYRDEMVGWMKENRARPREMFSIKSFDGLTLRGIYYEYEKGAPIELMFHGYRGTSERDLCGGVRRCFALGRSALMIDQRASGESEGNVISFGINEHKDCLRWVDFAISHFGKDCKLMLTGISMGAATVLMAAGHSLPENVIGVLADCGYSSPKAIIKKVIRDMKLPADLLYPLVKLGARLYGGFDLEETSAEEAMKTCSVPVIFVHGDADDFVPYQMSKDMYEICTSKKKLITVEGVGHGLAYPADKEGYIEAVRSFKDEGGY